MRYAVGVVVMARLAVLQSSVLARMPFLEGTPNLILLATVSWALVGRPAEAMIQEIQSGEVQEKIGRDQEGRWGIERSRTCCGP